MIQHRPWYWSILPFLLLTLIPAVLPAQERTISLEPVKDTNITQLWPGLFRRGNQVYATWGEQRPQAGSDQLQNWYSIGRWPENAETFAPIVATLRPDSIGADDPAATWPFGHGHREVPQSYIGAVFVGSSHWREDQQKVAPNDVIHKANYIVYVPNGSGWKSVTVFNDRKSGPVGDPTTEVAVFERGDGYNPRTGELLTAWTSGSATTGTVTAIDTAGNLLWSTPGIPMTSREINIIPMSGRTFLMIVDSTVTTYSDGTPGATWKIPMVFRPRYLRLADDRFVRFYTDTTAVTRLTIESYAFNGTAGASYVMTRNDTLASHTLTQSAFNGDLAMVSSGPLGVFVDLFDDKLAPSEFTFKLSKETTPPDTAGTAAAIFTRDSLYVIWQSYHGTSVDIHGNTIPAREGGEPPVSAPDDRRFAFSVGSVTPNPARESAGFSLQLPRGASVEIELADQLGRVVRHDLRRLPEGRSDMSLDLAGLPAGAYTVVVRAGGVTNASRLTIVR